MGRFVAIVVILVIVAIVVNRSVEQQSDAEQLATQSAGAAQDESLDSEDADSARVGLVSARSERAPSTEESSASSESKEIILETDVDTKGEENVAEAVEGAASELSQQESVLLGTGELLQGIPSEGDQLSLEEIEAWLEDPNNHVLLQPELPLGLAAGAGAIRGIEENPMTRAKIELGRQLFFDTRLSVDDTISCASCHDPEFGYGKDTRFGVGVGGQEGNRNSPVAYNRILSDDQFWDGRAVSLEDQAIGPIANAIEMGNTHEVCVKTIRGIEGYVKQFERVFDEGVTIENIGKAIATFERAIVTNPAPWDYYQQLETYKNAYAIEEEYLDEIKEEEPEVYEQYTEYKKASENHPISESAIRGGELFFSDKTGCTACHVGPNFTDEKYHNLGVGMDSEEPDLGRYAVTGEEKDRGAFKTPTVRNVALTGPYMHDGSQETLMEVVEWYAKGGHPNEYLSADIKKLDLTEQDKKDLVAFMEEGLTSDLPPVERGKVPAE